MKLMIPFAIQILVMSCFLSFLPGDSFAGGGHAHFGRSEFVNGSGRAGQIISSLTEIEAQTHQVENLLREGDFQQIESLAVSIHDISSWITKNSGMNRTRHANLKRASKSITRAADKLKKYASEGNAPNAEDQVKRIHKLLEFV